MPPPLRDAPRQFGDGPSLAPDMSAVSYNVLDWETTGIERATLTLFWMPFSIGAEDDPGSLPGFTKSLPMAQLLGGPARELSFVGTGSGPLRYQALLRFAPRELPTDTASGFEIHRRYYLIQPKARACAGCGAGCEARDGTRHPNLERRRPRGWHPFP